MSATASSDVEEMLYESSGASVTMETRRENHHNNNMVTGMSRIRPYGKINILRLFPILNLQMARCLFILVIYTMFLH